MSKAQPLGGTIFTPFFMAMMVLFAISVYFLGVRFTEGMGAVANINGGYPWGIWVVYDVVIGTALACGGYALAITIYLFNKGQYHPLMRAALLASLLGYALGGIGAFIDMGRYWQFYNLLLPWHMNFNAVMLEVGLCVATYILVLVIEFAPAFLERIGATGLLKALNKVLFLFIALGILLPTMHQSSLGSFLVAMGYKVAPLWQTVYFQPVLALLTALCMGFSIVIFEASMSKVAFKLDDETHLLSKLGKIIVGILSVYLVIRFAEILMHGKFGYIFAGDKNSLLFIMETVLFIIPIVILSSQEKRNNPKVLIWAAVSMLFAGSLYRFNAFLLTYDPGPGYSYFPSVSEIMVTVGIVAFEIMAYIVLVKTLPVLHKPKHA
ncbi:MAG: Ni/Fe-hydrogenase cytochrome b subunit [Methylocystaceae bacterium]|nr:Ni/Fe-hydrogenase cytochrome b subunit [Methylocystaceae bacterium]